MNRNFIASDILEIAILEMCRLKAGKSFSPTDVVQWIYPQHWHYFLSEVHDSMMQLYKAGKIIVLQNNDPLEQDTLSNGPITIKSNPKTS